MRSSRLWLLLLLLPALGGCPKPTLLSEQPMGDEIAVLDPAKVDGVWLGAGVGNWHELIKVGVLDGPAGKLYWHDISKGCESPGEYGGVFFWRRQPVPQRPRGIPRLCDACYFYFAYTATEEDREATHKEIFRAFPFAVLSDASSFAVFYWTADDVDNRLLRLVGKGVLPGRLEANWPGAPVVLGPLLPEHYRVLLSPESGLFQWQDPRVYIKLPDAIDPCRKRPTTQ